MSVGFSIISVIKYFYSKLSTNDIILLYFLFCLLYSMIKYNSMKNDNTTIVNAIYIPLIPIIEKKNAITIKKLTCSNIKNIFSSKNVINFIVYNPFL